MEITVKRRTWFLGILMPLKLAFNGEKITNIHAFQDKTIQIPEEAGRLKYSQPFDLSDQIYVKDGDTVIIKETSLNKIANIVFLATMAFFLFSNNYTPYRESAFYAEMGGALLPTILIPLGVIALGTIFFSSHKLVTEDESR
ncbi:hypothetical protein ACFOLA_04480 [Salinicoccus hispanicus]|uniref:Uncharacterized protein n=1 Tax=Salinicoccus hispanicus TaxID=157225 RepID=A0A6N8U2T3_9STAP|nr:hypothetical protein [Salinicoccus hispanicus]MXQ52072.1 hypothetical protein [Salinicoccus hispanicus]